MKGRLFAAMTAMVLGGCSGEFGHAAAEAASIGSAECEGHKPDDVVRSFYTAYAGWRKRDQAGGLPSVEAMAQYKPLFSQQLTDAIERARRRQNQFIRQHPDDKPPHIEGNLFGSLSEGFTGVESATLKAGGDPTTVTVGFVYDDGTDTAARWSDDVLLLCEQGQWRMDDVIYRGNWDFAPQGRLRERLEGE